MGALDQVRRKDIANCECFSLLLDKSTDMSDTAQLCIFIRMVFTDMASKKELLKVLLMKEHTWGEDIFLQKLYWENPAPSIQIGVHHHRQRACDDSSNGFIASCREDDAFPDFLYYHCIIHTLCTKMLNMKEIMDVATKFACSIAPDLFKDGYFVRNWRSIRSCCYTLTWDGLVEGNSWKDIESSVQRLSFPV